MQVSPTELVLEPGKTVKLTARSFDSRGRFLRDPGEFFEWVKFRSHLSRGVTVGTMLQDEALHFLRIGTGLFGER